MKLMRKFSSRYRDNDADATASVIYLEEDIGHIGDEDFSQMVDAGHLRGLIFFKAR